jgi:hypothetical protein
LFACGTALIVVGFMAASVALSLYFAGQQVAGSEAEVLNELRSDDDQEGIRDALTSFNICDVGSGEIPKACAEGLVAVAARACSEGLMMTGAISLACFAMAGYFPIRASCH